MTLQEALDRYIAWQRSHGTKFESTAGLLHRFCASINGEIESDAITDSQIRRFLDGDGSLTRYRANKYGALASFYHYAISRGYASRSPLPKNEPKRPSSAPPYIYSQEELRHLFGAIDVCCKSAVQLKANTFRTLLLLLYGAGLRSGEALHLTLEDIDLADAVLSVHDTKFYKSRLVPVGPQLADTLRDYAVERTTRPLPAGRASSFLANLDGTPVNNRTALRAFARLRVATGIHGKEGTQSPSLHSFRHTFAVHRLTAWYRQDADVQDRLPALSTYLGHASLAATQVYLSMTPELLQQASLRFERYARGGNDE